MARCSVESQKAITEPVPCAVSAKGEPEPESEPCIRVDRSERDVLLLDKGEQPAKGEQGDQLKQRQKRKKGAISLSRRIVAFDPKTAEKMRRCENVAHLETCKRCGTESIKSVFHCDNRFCPICSRRRSARLVEKYAGAIERYSKEKGLYGSFLTVTYVNTPMLQERKAYTKHIRNLLRRSLWKLFGGIDGGSKNFEVTFSKDGLYHPHVHMLIFTPKPIPSYTNKEGKLVWQNDFNAAVSNAWREITGDSYIVQGMLFDGSVQEMMKYFVKQSDVEKMSDENLEELMLWSKKKRLFEAFGGLRKYVANIQDEEEKKEPCACKECGGLSFERLVLQFDERVGCYLPVDVYDVHYGADVAETGQGPP